MRSETASVENARYLSMTPRNICWRPSQETHLCAGHSMKWTRVMDSPEHRDRARSMSPYRYQYEAQAGPICGRMERFMGISVEWNVDW